MAGGGPAARVRRGWSDLPSDMLVMVYRRWRSSPYDRTRFAAVCSSWRAVASWHPKLPALSLLLPVTGDAANMRAYTLDDGRALRVPLRRFPWGKRVVGSHDSGWVAVVTGARLHIVNVFSGARVPLSLKQSIIGCKFRPRVANRIADDAENPVTKIIFSEDPSSSDCVIAAITRPVTCNLVLCRVGCPEGGWTTGRCGTDVYERLVDIAFCNKRLYGIAYGDLYTFDVGMSENGAPAVTSVHRIDIENGISRDCWIESHEKYVFQLRGKLAIAMKFYGWSCGCNPFFGVFELLDSACTWVEVISLGEHALFLGQFFCKALQLPIVNGCNRVEKNRIYYFEEQLCPDHNTKCLRRFDFGSYTVYYRKSGSLDPSQRIMSWGYHYSYEDASNGCIWILPPNL